jgi:carbon starvation protein
MFGVSNQLLAAIALGVGTTIIIRSGKARYAWVTAVPMAFMLATTFSASWQLWNIFLAKAASTHGGESTVFSIDAALVALMAALAVIVVVDMARVWVKIGKEKVLTRNNISAMPISEE